MLCLFLCFILTLHAFSVHTCEGKTMLRDAKVMNGGLVMFKIFTSFNKFDTVFSLNCSMNSVSTFYIIYLLI